MQSNPLGTSWASILRNPARSPRGHKWSEILLTSSRGNSLAEETRVPQMPPWDRSPQKQSMSRVSCNPSCAMPPEGGKWGYSDHHKSTPMENQVSAQSSTKQPFLCYRDIEEGPPTSAEEGILERYGNGWKNERMKGKEFGDFCK